MRKKFAIELQSEKYGQLLLMRTMDDDQNPRLSVYFDPDIEGVPPGGATVHFATADLVGELFEETWQKLLDWEAVDQGDAEPDSDAWMFNPLSFAEEMLDSQEGFAAMMRGARREE